MSMNMDTLFQRARRPMRIHFDDTRISAVAIRQLSWRVEQGGGAIAAHPSDADVLVVDPAAPWVFHDFLRATMPQHRPSVVLAFWIPLCLTTRSLIWINHPYWQQVVIPSERPSHSEIPQGITAYSSFLAGITYSKIAPFSSTKTTPGSSNALGRDSSVISNVDNSDLEVSRSLEPGASSDDEPLETARKPKRSVPRRENPRSELPSTATSPQRPTEAQKDEAEVSGILPVHEVSLPLDDVEMSPPSPLPERVQRVQKEAIAKNVAPSGDSARTELAEKHSTSLPDTSGPRRHRSSRHSSPRIEREISPSHAGSPSASAVTAVEPDSLLESNSMQPGIETEPLTAPQNLVTKPTSVASERVTAPKGAYVPPTLDSTPSPASEQPNGTPLKSSPQVPNVLKVEPPIGTTAALNGSRASHPSASTGPSMGRSEPAAIPGPSSALDELQETQNQASIETNVSSKSADSTGSTFSFVETPSPTKSIKPPVSTSTAPPNTPAPVSKTSAPSKRSSISTSTGLRYVPDPSSGAPSSKSPKAKVRPKMRPPPQTDEGDSVASTSVRRTSLPHPKSKLNIQSSANGASTKLRPSVVASTTGSPPLIKSSQGSASTTTAPVASPGSTASSSVTIATSSAIATPATTVAADTPNPVPGSSLSRPKKLIIRSPTISTTPLGRPSASVSPIQSRHPAPTSASRPRSPSPDLASLYGPYGPPPTPPTPTPEQLAALNAKRPAWTKEEDQYIIDYMNWAFAQDPLASTSEIMKEIAANCQYRSAGNWRNRFKSKEDSIYMNEVPILFERLTNKTSGGSSSRNSNKTLEILSGTRTRSRATADYVESSGDENEGSSDDGSGPPRKRSRRSRVSGRRQSGRLG